MKKSILFVVVVLVVLSELLVICGITLQVKECPAGNDVKMYAGQNSEGCYYMVEEGQEMEFIKWEDMN